jgi:ABC-type Fe3+-hydroxamate transport system substrate-binding protein
VAFFWEDRFDNEQVLFRWQGLQTLDEYINYTANHFYSKENTLFYVAAGNAVWKINEQILVLEPGRLIGLAAGTLVDIVDATGLSLEGWAIEFRQYRLLGADGSGAGLSLQDWILPEEQQVLWTGTPGRDTGEQIKGLDLPGMGLIEQELGRHQLLYTLLGALYKPAESGKSTTDQGVLRSITYMHEHYYMSLTRDELARIAGLSPWHYSRKFRGVTGKPPLDYLNRYRIYRAQERLLLTEARTQDISKQVGFEDAYYFSRRFKQLAGVSPRGYVRSIGSRSMCVLSPIIAETLLALGIVPKAVLIVPALLAPHQRYAFEQYRVKMIPISQYALDIQSIYEEDPQFIISQTIREETKVRLMAIAPVAAGLSSDLLPAIAQLAAIFRKEQEAEQLYERMNVVIEQARGQLAELIQSRATVMVLRVEPFGYRYLGAHSIGVSRILYRDLGLAIPPALNEGQNWFNPLRLEQLQLANPDYIYVEDRVMEGGDTRIMMEALLDSQYWKQLDAVKNNRVIKIDTSLWIGGCGPLGHALIVDQIIATLTKS